MPSPRSVAPPLERQRAGAQAAAVAKATVPAASVIGLDQPAVLLPDRSSVPVPDLVTLPLPVIAAEIWASSSDVPVLTVNV